MRILRGSFCVFVPGGVLLGTKRYLSGALVFVFWAALVEGYVFVSAASLAGMPGYVKPAFLTGACAVYALNAIAALHRLYRESRPGVAEERRVLYSQALAAFVAGEDAKSDRLLKKLLRLDVLDADCLFLRAQAALRQGRNRKAKRLFRKCADFDENDKWGWEIRRALQKV